MSSVPDHDMMTIREVAELLRVSEITVARWIKQGRLPAFRVGPRAVRIRRADVVGLMKPANAGVALNADAEPGIVLGLPMALPSASDVEQRAEAFRRAKDLRQRILERRGGKPLTDSANLIRDVRARRSQRLAREL